MNDSFHYSRCGKYWHFIHFITGENFSLPLFWTCDKYSDVSLRFPSHTSASMSWTLLHGLLCFHLSQTLVALLQPLPLVLTQRPSWCLSLGALYCNRGYLPEETARTRVILVAYVLFRDVSYLGNFLFALLILLYE